jgi:hypothetical protein
MVEPNPETRMNMNGVLDFMEEHNQRLKEVRLNLYRQLSLQGMKNLGVVGSIIGCLNAQLFKSATPTTMDLRIYGRLYRQLAAVNN